jgi:hypothetical protein
MLARHRFSLPLFEIFRQSANALVAVKNRLTRTLEPLLPVKECLVSLARLLR